MEEKKEQTSFKVEPKKVTGNIGGRELTLETGRLANQANGSVLVTYGDSVFLGTAVMSNEPREGLDFFPLTVDYEENHYAAGKVRGSRFMKRKGKPSDDSVLTGRVLDRSIRPLFPEGMRNEVQVIITALSFDRENDPDFLSLVAGSAALAISDIPFETTLGAVKVGLIDNELVINPKITENEKNKLNLTVSITKEGKIAMIEAGAKEVPEEKVKEAIKLAQEESSKVIELIEELVKKAGKEKKIVPLYEIDSSVLSFTKEKLADQVREIIRNYKDKPWFDQEIRKLKETRLEEIKSEFNKERGDEEVAGSMFGAALEKIVKEEIRSLWNQDGKRIDKRAIDEVRPLQIEVGVLPRTHGSAIFARGLTQGLTNTTLGAPGESLILDGMADGNDTKKDYMHFYSFPPFSVGEVRPMRGPGRREIGHGALGEKALEAVMPDKEIFPYTIVMHTEIMSSDGSTSMASVCGSTLALMDAGVPIKRPVTGIAMGLMYDKEKEKYAVLTDLCATEDFSGFMDFKVAGTTEGITAIQMDIKLKGIPYEVIEEAFEKAGKAREEILSKMLSVLPKSRENLSPFAPRVATIQIPVDKIRDVIGPGGKVINEIIDRTGASIDIEQDGLVSVASENEEGLNKALEMIRNLTKEVEKGEFYTGKVVKIMDFGAFVSLLPNKDGLVHISEITDKERVNDIKKYLSEGDEVKVKVKDIDRTGRISLTMIF